MMDNLRSVPTDEDPSDAFDALSCVRPHLQDLNPEQRRAVEHGQGPLLVFAGAGSGKTRVLTRRIAHLIMEHQVSPGQIFAVTFTNKAAQEMKERVARLFNHRNIDSWVSTFHSSCARILRSHAKLLDYQQNFAIYDTSDSRTALKRAYQKLNIDTKIIDIGMVRSRIDRAKNEYLFPDDLRKETRFPATITEMIADLYEYYQRELKTSNAMDFGDLLCNVLTLFRLEPKILAQFQERFTHLLIDEYQDTNRVQYRLVKMLAERHKNLCVVGDDDQSIYAFRGATVENILNFKKDFPDATVITLHANYRSTQNILQAANSLISKNSRRQKKTMTTENPLGKAIGFFVAYDELEEGNFVVQEIMSLIKGGTKGSDIAIFYRTNAQSRALEEALCNNGLPYQIYGGQRFYERKEIKDMLAYFRLILNHDDNVAFLRVINTPTRGLGAASVSELVFFAEQTRISLFQALERAVANNATFLTTANKTRFSNFFMLIQSLSARAAETNELLQQLTPEPPPMQKIEAIANLLKEIADKTDYLRRLKAEDTLEAESRIENIFELFRVATEFVGLSLNENREIAVSDFLDRASLSSDADSENSAHGNPQTSETTEKSKTEYISLMTLHLAKGLEFEIVFLVGLEDGVLPHIRSLESQQELEEERRLCYVGITRAKKRLYLTRATSRQSFGRSNWYTGRPSRFLRDLPLSVMEERRM